MARFFSIVVCILPLCAVLLFLSRAAAQQPKPSQQQQLQNQQENQQQDQSQDLRTRGTCPFTGTISKKEGRFYLADHWRRQTYLLDDAWLARRHVGANVLVHGTLDQEKNLIRVRSISDIQSNVFPRCDSLLSDPQRLASPGIAV